MIPFLKWPGGKRWLIRSHSNLLSIQYKRYIEPFLGGGSVYFHLMPSKAVLADTNRELIDTYRAIRDSHDGVVTALRKYHRLHSEDLYYTVRESAPRSPISKAARMIYLNRTCFNGIYRVNYQGKFNVPIGTKTSVLLPTDDFAAAGKLLTSAELRVSDFEPVIDEAINGDFIFADPPYTINHNNNGFVKYNEKLFSWEDQKRLANCLKLAAKRGAVILSTNADHDAVKRLYRNAYFSLVSAQRYSSISSANRSRIQYREVVIRSRHGAILQSKYYSV